MYLNLHLLNHPIAGLMLIIIIISVLCFFTSPIQSTQPAATINVWPKPRIFNWPQPTAHFLSPNFTIIFSSHCFLSLAADHYLQLIFAEHYHPLVTPSFVHFNTCAPPLHTLSVTVSDLGAQLHHRGDKSYSLSVPSQGGFANIMAETAWGAMRGLETFSQLVWENPPAVVVGLYIWDSPLFPHRVVMLDTSRNFYGVDDILRTIKSMTQNKLNVFHRHITDSHSFPLVLPSKLELAAKGLYSYGVEYSLVYVNRILEFRFGHDVRIQIQGVEFGWKDSHPNCAIILRNIGICRR